ncbi:hypothetical protein T4D_13090 [Trichinella pseudospiralis]|uniref:Matrin-type domain-containing protein n=1 Tax=Trichinella pseudospiralis TaxID=6337 RepID=A0A0V1FTJ2_TRIPS|nr:hypothetical protein T4D_13090 [Trichinella pseudospiralis]
MGISGSYFCMVCNSYLNSAKQAHGHCNGKKHQNKLQLLNMHPQINISDKQQRRAFASENFKNVNLLPDCCYWRNMLTPQPYLLASNGLEQCNKLCTALSCVVSPIVDCYQRQPFVLGNFVQLYTPIKVPVDQMKSHPWLQNTALAGNYSQCGTNSNRFCFKPKDAQCHLCHWEDSQIVNESADYRHTRRMNKSKVSGNTKSSKNVQVHKKEEKTIRHAELQADLQSDSTADKESDENTCHSTCSLSDYQNMNSDSSYGSSGDEELKEKFEDTKLIKRRSVYKQRSSNKQISDNEKSCNEEDIDSDEKENEDLEISKVSDSPNHHTFFAKTYFRKEIST